MECGSLAPAFTAPAAPTITSGSPAADRPQLRSLLLSAKPLLTLRLCVIFWASLFAGCPILAYLVYARVGLGFLLPLSFRVTLNFPDPPHNTKKFKLTHYRLSLRPPRLLKSPMLLRPLGADINTMNFPCNNCRTIRPFSGQPPRCEVCGWELHASPPNKSDVPHREPGPWLGEEKVARGILPRVVFSAIVIVAVAYLAFHFGARSWLPALGKHAEPPSQYGIALKYGVTMEQVIMDPKPPGCDFNDSPIGDKHCHFETLVNVVRSCLTPNCPVERVYVSWHKVRD